jgi:hypothetical protein
MVGGLEFVLGGKVYVEGIEKKSPRRLFASKGTKPTGN